MSESQEWTTVSDGNVETEPEVKIVFEEFGDEYIGEFLGYRDLTDRATGQNYKQARFRDPDGTICYTRANHSMQEGLDRVPIGAQTRLVYVTDTDTGMPSPMRTFTVQTKGRATAASNTAVSTSSRPVRRAGGNKGQVKPKPGEKA